MNGQRYDVVAAAVVVDGALGFHFRPPSVVSRSPISSDFGGHDTKRKRKKNKKQASSSEPTNGQLRWAWPTSATRTATRSSTATSSVATFERRPTRRNEYRRAVDRRTRSDRCDRRPIDSLPREPVERKKKKKRKAEEDDNQSNQTLLRRAEAVPLKISKTDPLRRAVGFVFTLIHVRQSTRSPSIGRRPRWQLDRTPSRLLTHRPLCGFH